MRLRSFLPFVVAALASAPQTAFADDQETCARAFEHGQQLRMAGRLSSAAEEFATCVAECPAALAKECRTWSQEIERDMPKLVVRVRGSDGCEMKTARLRLDDRTETFAPGSKTPVDPGRHRVSATPLGGPTHEEVFTVALGEEKSLDVVIDMRACAPPPTPPPLEARGRPTPAIVYVLGAVGVAGLGTFAGFGAWGLAQQGDLDGCKPSCPDGDVDAMYRTYLVADVGLAVGLVSLAAATVLYLTRPEVTSTRAASSDARRGWP